MLSCTKNRGVYIHKEILRDPLMFEKYCSTNFKSEFLPTSVNPLRVQSCWLVPLFLAAKIYWNCTARPRLVLLFWKMTQNEFDN